VKELVSSPSLARCGLGIYPICLSNCPPPLSIVKPRDSHRGYNEASDQKDGRNLKLVAPGQITRGGGQHFYNICRQRVDPRDCGGPYANLLTNYMLSPQICST
jgi:hypothetical protein